MKIIASTGNSKWLAEVNSFELRELNSEIAIEIGVEYEIRKAAETLATLRSLRRNKLEYISKYINDLQAKFGEIEEAYDALMLIDTIKHSEDNE